jgi:hypothetical protein
MVRKILPWLLAAAAALVIAGQRKDIARYVRIKQMSVGTATPRASPPAGRRPTRSPAPESRGDR